MADKETNTNEFIDEELSSSDDMLRQGTTANQAEAMSNADAKGLIDGMGSDDDPVFTSIDPTALDQKSFENVAHKLAAIAENAQLSAAQKELQKAEVMQELRDALADKGLSEELIEQKLSEMTSNEKIDVNNDVMADVAADDSGLDSDLDSFEQDASDLKEEAASNLEDQSHSQGADGLKMNSEMMNNSNNMQDSHSQFNLEDHGQSFSSEYRSFADRFQAAMEEGGFNFNFNNDQMQDIYNLMRDYATTNNVDFNTLMDNFSEIMDAFEQGDGSWQGVIDPFEGSEEWGAVTQIEETEWGATITHYEDGTVVESMDDGSIFVYNNEEGEYNWFGSDGSWSVYENGESMSFDIFNQVIMRNDEVHSRDGQTMSSQEFWNMQSGATDMGQSAYDAGAYVDTTINVDGYDQTASVYTYQDGSIPEAVYDADTEMWSITYEDGSSSSWNADYSHSIYVDSGGITWEYETDIVENPLGYNSTVTLADGTVFIQDLDGFVNVETDTLISFDDFYAQIYDAQTGADIVSTNDMSNDLIGVDAAGGDAAGVAAVEQYYDTSAWDDDPSITFDDATGMYTQVYEDGASYSWNEDYSESVMVEANGTQWDYSYDASSPEGWSGSVSFPNGDSFTMTDAGYETADGVLFSHEDFFNDVYSQYDFSENMDVAQDMEIIDGTELADTFVIDDLDGLIINNFDAQADSIVVDIDNIGMSSEDFSGLSFNSDGTVDLSDLIALSADEITEDTRFIFDDEAGTISYDADGSGVEFDSINIVTLHDVEGGELSMDDVSFISTSHHDIV